MYIAVVQRIRKVTVEFADEPFCFVRSRTVRLKEFHEVIPASCIRKGNSIILFLCFIILFLLLNLGFYGILRQYKF